MGMEAINGDICYLQLLPSFGLIRFYLNINIKKKLREQPCIWAWISCVKITCKTIYNNTVRLSMSMWPQEKSLFKIFSVGVNANHPFSSKLTILTISRKSLFLVHILGGLWKRKRFFASHLWTHGVTLSWLPQNRVIIQFPADPAAYLKMQTASI